MLTQAGFELAPSGASDYHDNISVHVQYLWGWFWNKKKVHVVPVFFPGHTFSTSDTQMCSGVAAANPWGKFFRRPIVIQRQSRSWLMVFICLLRSDFQETFANSSWRPNLRSCDGQWDTVTIKAVWRGKDTIIDSTGSTDGASKPQSYYDVPLRQVMLVQQIQYVHQLNHHITVTLAFHLSLVISMVEDLECLTNH